jgi:hypothetical protein
VPTKVRLTGVSVDIHALLTSMVAFDSDPNKTMRVHHGEDLGNWLARGANDE